MCCTLAGELAFCETCEWRLHEKNARLNARKSCILPWVVNFYGLYKIGWIINYKLGDHQQGADVVLRINNCHVQDVSVISHWMTSSFRYCYWVDIEWKC